MEIIVEKVDKMLTKTGKVYYLVTDTNGEKYSVWDGPIAESMSPGLKIDADVSERNGYKSIKSFLTTGSRATAEEMKPRAGNMTKDKLIVAQTLTKCASEIFANFVDAGVDVDQYMAVCKMVVAGFNQISEDIA